MYSPRWRFSKAEMYRISVDGRKPKFSNTMTSCLGSELALTHIQFENAWCGHRFFKIRRKKLSVFENTRLRVDNQIRYKKPYRWTQIIFKYGGSTFCFRKYPATCGRCLNLYVFKRSNLINGQMRTSKQNLCQHVILPHGQRAIYKSVTFASKSV